MLYPLSYERSHCSIPPTAWWSRPVRLAHTVIKRLIRRSKHAKSVLMPSPHARGSGFDAPAWARLLTTTPITWPEVKASQTRPIVQQLLYTDCMSVGFRPTEEDLRVIEANRREDEKTSDVIRRALRLLDREAWEERARADMHRLKSEDLSAEADAWEYDADGSIKIVGTNVTVQPRPTDRS